MTGIAALENTARSDSGDPPPSDGQLLERFVETGDQEAFAHLFARHGAYILGVCRRLMTHAQDAEDVFQACFLELARNAATIRRRDSVADWLHTVAVRMSRRARGKRVGRQQRVATGIPEEPTVDPEDMTWRETRRILEEEIARLPDDLRCPMITCFFQGKTQEEAGQILGMNPRTLKARLARGREMLRQRLLRRGVALAVLGAVLSSSDSQAAVSLALEQVTVRAATAVSKKTALNGIVSPEVLALIETSHAAAVSWGLIASAALVLAVGAGTALVYHGPTAAPLAQQVVEGSRRDTPGDGAPGRLEVEPPPRDDERDAPETVLAPAQEQEPVESIQRIAPHDQEVKSADRGERLIFMKESLKAYLFTRGAEAMPIDLRDGPLLRWSNPVNGDPDGALFIWTAHGRPQAAVQVFRTKGGYWLHELQSLCTDTFQATNDGNPAWEPAKAGLEMRHAPESPEPAESGRQRLAQMRAIADEYSAIDDFGGKQSRWELRLLTTPLYRYADPDRGIVDGALWAFVHGTDPEVFVVLEASETPTGLEWQIGMAPMTAYAVEVSRKGKPVWNAPRRRQLGDPRETFLTRVYWHEVEGE